MSIYGNAIIRWAAWHIKEGEPEDVVRRKLIDKFPSETLDSAASLISSAQLSLRVAREFEEAAGPETLRDLLHGVNVPEDRVSVSLLFRYAKPDGEERENTMKVLTRWDATVEQILSAGYAMLEDVTARYGEIVVHSVEVVGGILTPAEAQI